MVIPFHCCYELLKRCCECDMEKFKLKICEEFNKFYSCSSEAIVVHIDNAILHCLEHVDEWCNVQVLFRWNWEEYWYVSVNLKLDAFCFHQKFEN